MKAITMKKSIFFAVLILIITSSVNAQNEKELLANKKILEKILEKYLNFGHHNEYEDISIKLEDIQKMISEKSVGYNHLADQKEKNKISFISHKLKKIPIMIIGRFFHYRWRVMVQ